MEGRSQRVGGIYLTKLGDLSPHAGQGLLCGGGAEDHGGQACDQPHICHNVCAAAFRALAVRSGSLPYLEKNPEQSPPGRA
jgi:hypothetical protein